MTLKKPSFEHSVCLKIVLFFMYSVGCDIKQELSLVKNKIYSELIANKGIHVYQPEMFREFCISAGATNIFDAILDAITSARHSTERINLNKKRTVSVIYNLCYCLSQACNTLQTDHALYLRSCNLNQEGIETQHIMGLSCARRTVNTIAKSMSENHCKSFKHFIQDAIENKWLLVLIIDDFTSIHTKRRPQADKASEAKSMCTIVVKAFKNIPAVSVLQASIMHDVNGISINTCIQIITSASCMQNMSSSYASVMPNWLTEAFLTQNFNTSDLTPISIQKTTMCKQCEKWMTFTLLTLWSYNLSPKRTLMQHMT